MIGWRQPDLLIIIRSPFWEYCISTTHANFELGRYRGRSCWTPCKCIMRIPRLEVFLVCWRCCNSPESAARRGITDRDRSLKTWVAALAVSLSSASTRRLTSICAALSASQIQFTVVYWLLKILKCSYCVGNGDGDGGVHRAITGIIYGNMYLQ